MLFKGEVIVKANEVTVLSQTSLDGSIMFENLEIKSPAEFLKFNVIG